MIKVKFKMLANLLEIDSSINGSYGFEKLVYNFQERVSIYKKMKPKKKIIFY